MVRNSGAASGQRTGFSLVFLKLEQTFEGALRNAASPPCTHLLSSHLLSGHFEIYTSLYILYFVPRREALRSVSLTLLLKISNELLIRPNDLQIIRRQLVSFNEN